jgi:hypothetical protein
VPTTPQQKRRQIQGEAWLAGARRERERERERDLSIYVPVSSLIQPRQGLPIGVGGRERPECIVDGARRDGLKVAAVQGTSP